jgi:ABC-type transport system involved in multi-copper enzyme maturation permease subunit
MRGTFLATWVGLRRPALLVGTAAVTAVVTALITLVTFANAGQGAGTAPGASDTAWTTASLSGPGGLTAGLAEGAGMLGVVAFCVAGGLLAGRFSTGIVRNLLLRQPERARVLAGSWAALVVFALGLVAVSALVAVGVALAVAGGHGVHTDGWFTGSGVARSARTLGCVALSTTGYVTIGTVLGVLLRAPVVTVAAGLSWFLVVELVFGDSVTAQRWLPGRLLGEVAGAGSAAVPFGTALLTVTGYLVATSVTAVLAFTRRDVTA